MYLYFVCFVKHVSSLVLPEENPSGSKRCKICDEVLYIRRLSRLFSHIYLHLTYLYNLQPERQVIQDLDYLKLVESQDCSSRGPHTSTIYIYVRILLANSIG